MRLTCINYAFAAFILIFYANCDSERNKTTQKDMENKLAQKGGYLSFGG